MCVCVCVRALCNECVCVLVRICCALSLLGSFFRRTAQSLPPGPCTCVLCSHVSRECVCLCVCALCNECVCECVCLFAALYPCWAHSSGALLSLCLLAHVRIFIDALRVCVCCLCKTFLSFSCALQLPKLNTELLHSTLSHRHMTMRMKSSSATTGCPWAQRCSCR